ncbi:hypothetical protein DJ66_1276 [Candidatus Liberibacter solanacearum]|uniref:Uncharacterized protein n=2 Tax=Candidatus Liberibacter solanacearum TaxID=556287 RepID=A0A0F4VJG2_9HYPH|nr:hypothetical protein DJ66_1276 [Candidatus Liberibacter solanacearum]
MIASMICGLLMSLLIILSFSIMQDKKPHFRIGPSMQKNLLSD